MTFTPSSYRQSNKRSAIRAWTVADVKCASGQRSNGALSDQPPKIGPAKNPKNKARNFRAIVKHV